MLIFLRCSPWPRRFVNDKSSTAALEFALILPILIVLFFGMYDTAEGMITYEEVFNATRTIAASVSDASSQGPNSSTLLYYGQIQQQASAIFAEMPMQRSGFQNGLKSITVSSVNFEQAVTSPACTPGNCDYYAYVVWSVAYQGPSGATGLNIVPALRNCATESNGKTLDTNSALTQVLPTSYSPSDLTQLRTQLIANPAPFAAAPDPIIVVDIHFQFTPLFNVFVKNPINFWTDAYFPLRSVQATQENAAGTAFTQLASDQQYTGLVSYGANTSATEPGPFTVTASDVYQTGFSLESGASKPATTNYCISPYYPEPTSCTLSQSTACTAS